MGVHYNKADFITYGRPSLFLDFANKKSLTDRISGNNLITFTRTSTGTYVGADGLIKSATTNEARFDHNPLTGESLGLLIEEQRTNLLSYSNYGQYTGRQWAYAYGLRDNSALAPDGTYTAIFIPSAPGNTLTFYSFAYSLLANTAYTVSFFAKSAGWSRVGIRGWYDGITYRLSHTTINLITKEIVQNGSNPIIEDYGNGWLRITISFTTANAVNSEIAIEPHNTALAQTDEVGDGINGIYIWGIDFQQASFSTSHIPTPATFTSRNSTATYYDSTGILRTAAVNEARSNAYFPDSNGIIRYAGLVLETAGTNLVTNSEDLTQASWVKTNCTVSSNQTTAPDGNSTADKFIVSSDSVSTRHEISAGLGSQTDIVTFSIFAKSGERTTATFKLGGTAVAYEVPVNLLTGSVGSIYAANVTSTSYSILKLPNGWFRISITAKSTTAAPLTVGVVFEDSIGNGSAGLFLWGAQAQVSVYSTLLTSYIPTTGASATRSADVSTSSQVTRNADSASITGTNFSSWYNYSQSTVLIQGSRLGGTSDRLIELAGSSGENRIWANNDWYTSSYQSGETANNLQGITIPIGGFYKYAYGFEYNGSNTIKSAVRTGLNLVTSTTANRSIPNPAAGTASLNFVGLGINSKIISRFTYYPTRLTNAQLQNLTK